MTKKSSNVDFETIMEGEFYQDGISVNIVNRHATEQTYRKTYGNFVLKTIQI